MRFVSLPQAFFAPSADVVAPRLLGHWLVRQTEAGVCGGPIVETEAYLVGDPASHAFSGETARNRVMYGPPGHAYVYLIYGYHYCVNAVCHPVGRAEAVLIRAIEPQFGESLMRRNRPAATELGLTNGPARLCAALQITRGLDGADLCDAASPLFVALNPEADEFHAARGPIITTTRVGLTKAAEAPLRYYLDRSAYVSRRARPDGGKAIGSRAGSSRARRAR